MHIDLWPIDRVTPYDRNPRQNDQAVDAVAASLREFGLPVLRERFPNRGLVAGEPPEPCAVFPGVHPGIRRAAIFDDGDELTVCIDDLTHGHFAEYSDGLSELERAQQVVESVIEFLDDLFADRVVVWEAVGIGRTWVGQAAGPECRSSCGRDR